MSLTSDEGLSEPRRFEIAHHDHDHDHDHDKNHQHSDEVHPQFVEIGIFQEFFDIVRWLPIIAANSDLPKTEWDEVHRHCQTLTQLAAEIQKNAKSNDELDLRDSYRQISAQLNDQLNSLKSMFSVFDEWNEKVVN